MPVFLLEVNAALHNIASLSVPDDYAWHMVFKCTNCGENAPRAAVFHSNDEMEQIRGATVHLCLTCKFCDRRNDAKILEPFVHKYEAASDRQWRRFCALECRGMEPAVWEIVQPFDIRSATGILFDESTLDDGEFYEYDDKLHEDVSVTEFQWRFTR